MKAETTTTIEISFTSSELCDALQQASINQIREKIGDVISKGVTPKFSITLNEIDYSAILKVTVTH